MLGMNPFDEIKYNRELINKELDLMAECDIDIDGSLDQIDPASFLTGDDLVEY